LTTVKVIFPVIVDGLQKFNNLRIEENGKEKSNIQGQRD
jgi:hypothetical protein